MATLLLLGLLSKSSSSRGINGIENDNRERHSGAVYLFRYDGLTWKQQAYLKASNGQAEDYFGIAVSLSSDGNTLAVGADYEDGSLSDGVEDSGAVYIFQYDGAEWNQQAYLKASNAGRYDYFGYQISLSGDGKTLAVGVESEASNSTGINGNEADNSLTKAGAVYLFREENSNWEQLAYIKASNTHIHENFGSSVSISADGNTLAVGAESEDSSSIGIGGDELNSDAVNSGAVFLYHYNGSNWSQQAYIKPSNTNSWDFFGGALSLSANGGVLAVGARGESSSAIGINGDETVNNADSSGAVYLFRYEDSKWKQHAYIKAPNNDAYDAFGSAVGLSADGNILTVSAPEESSLATMINGDEANNNGHNVGAVYLY